MVAIASATIAGEPEAQGIPATAQIQVTGALREQRDGYGKFEFQAPDLLVIWVHALPLSGDILTVQMRKRGAGFIQAGRYAVGPGGPNHGPPQDSTVLEAIVQHESRMWTMDSGYVTIEKADTLEVTGHVSLRSNRLPKPEGSPPSDRIWIKAQFSVRYDPFVVEMRQKVHDRAEPHPPSPGRRPSPKPETLPPLQRTRGMPLEPGESATVRVVVRPTPRP